MQLQLYSRAGLFTTKRNDLWTDNNAMANSWITKCTTSTNLTPLIDLCVYLWFSPVVTFSSALPSPPFILESGQPWSYNLALCSSSFAMVPRWTSSGPSAIRSVLAVAHRCDRTVSDETPAAPWTCIAMSSTFRAIFGAATYMKAIFTEFLLLKGLKRRCWTLVYLCHCEDPTGFLVPMPVELICCFKHQKSNLLQFYPTLDSTSMLSGTHATKHEGGKWSLKLRRSKTNCDVPWLIVMQMLDTYHH